MISVIGFMVGSYILVRCVSFILRRAERSEPLVARILWGLCGLITIACLVYFVQGSGSSSATVPPALR